MSQTLTLRHDPRALALLLAASLTVMAAATISPALPGLQKQFPDTAETAYLIRLLVPAPSLAVVLTAALCGIAADRIGRTQSAVSMQIRRLEDSLGQSLFLRQPRGVELTPRGEQLVPYARRVVGLLDEAATALRVKPLVGPVRIGIPDEYSETVLPAPWPPSPSGIRGSR